ncbi:UvrD-helicase domain-containing protein [Flammeovirga agarivorans]|uniref:DNA 3'-5' helicase n=1 Tax=Flammeovirga agarivorans TaxID=2726742 RepID=A0A7X8SIF2_9BACT|nr:UvrD-helicase domain-containing protein [Flammeovirga agarivorans]NLR90717.1 UvrD-helicase domain-containing protein [Flammeovirga agarivorans]
MISKNFKIYRSSAGAGKTFTLAKEYIKIALQINKFDEEFDPEYYKHILAVTFTNLATAEMKERILSQLKNFANAFDKNSDDMLRAIVNEFYGVKEDDPNPEQEAHPDEKVLFNRIKNRSSQVHQRILHGYSNFSVSTIDAFSQKIAQAFKRDLNFPFNYELVLDADSLLEDATYVLMDKLGQEEHLLLTEALETFSIKKAEEESSWNVVPQIKSFGKALFDEDQRGIINKLGTNPVTKTEMNIEEYSKLAKRLKKIIYEDNQTKKDELLEKLKLDLSNAGAPVEDLAKNVGGFLKRFEGDIAKVNTKLTNTVIKALEGDTGRAIATAPNYKKAPAGYDAALPIYQNGIEELLKLVGDTQLIKNVYDKIYLLITAQVLKEEMANMKEEQGWVHISEIGENINKIVEESPMPYLYERLGEKYFHILIDEFQDTSKTQWHNLIPLVAHSLSMYEGECLVVGDAKQSIYRWRGGKAEMLVDLPEIPTAKGTALEEEEYVLKQDGDPKKLGKNYRSSPNIIRFNNSLYEFIRTQKNDELLSKFYLGGEQGIVKKVGGQVRLTACQKDGNKDLYEAPSLQRITDEIEHLVNEKNYDYKDIAILVRFNKHGAAIAEKLVQEGIEVISSESLLVNSAPSVQFIVNMIRLLVRRADKILFMKIARFLYAHYNDVKSLRWETVNQAPTQIHGDEYARIGEAVAECATHQNFEEFIKKEFDVEFSVSTFRRKTLFDQIEFLIKTFKLNKRTTEQAYQMKFLGTVLQHSTRNGNSAQEFLSKWELLKEKEALSVPENINAVRIFSIHKSKGLEFPVVLLPFADWSTTPRTNDSKWFDWENNNLVPELSAVQLGISSKLEGTDFEEGYNQEIRDVYIDAINMLYVATTRAKNYLHIFLNEDLKKKTASSVANPMIDFISFATGQSDFDVLEEASTTIDEIVFKEFRFFEDEKVVNKEKAAVEPENRREIIHTDNTDKLRMKSGSLEIGEKVISLEDRLLAKDKGILLHKAFEKIRFAEDVEDAIAFLKSKGYIDKEDVTDYRDHILQIINDEEIKQYFDGNSGYIVLNESEIVSPKKELMKASVIDRPDRLLLKGEEVVVIDYKTGSFNKEHEEQIKRYGRTLKSMGFKDIKLILLYTENIKSHQVDL